MVVATTVVVLHLTVVAVVEVVTQLVQQLMSFIHNHIKQETVC